MHLKQLSSTVQICRSDLVPVSRYNGRHATLSVQSELIHKLADKD